MPAAADPAQALAAGRCVGHERLGARRGRDRLQAFVRQLLAAVVCQAVDDALGGDELAARFVETEGAAIVLALGLPACCLDRWRTADVAHLRHTIGDEGARRRRFFEKRRQRNLSMRREPG